MSTINDVGVGLSGVTGTGSFVGSTSPTFVTPVLGTPTSGNLSNCTQGATVVISEQIFTSGSGTYTPTSGAKYVWVRAIAGGGQGGGTTTASAHPGAGAGGGSGGYAEFWEAATSRAYSVGAGGSTGTTGTGQAGGNTTFGTAGAQISVGGGGGGTTTASSSGFASTGGAGGTTTNGALQIAGGIGYKGNYCWQPTGLASGGGANSPLGIGGPAVLEMTGSSSGSNATGYGAGGSGAIAVGASLTGNGGTGSSGCIIIMEFA